MALQQFLGQFYLGTDANNFSVGGTGVVLTAGNYYTAGYTSEGTNQLCEHMQAQIRNIGATQDASTVVYNAITGFITITLETAATLVFDDAALATVLGYTATSYGSGTSFVATRSPRYIWRPSRSASDYPANLHAATFFEPKSTTRLGRSIGGGSWAFEGNVLYNAYVNYFCLDKTEVIIPMTGTTYQEFQQWWMDVIHKGKPVRFYPDRSINTSTDFCTIHIGKSDDEEGLGVFGEYASRHIHQYNGLWNLNLPIAKYI